MMYNDFYLVKRIAKEKTEGAEMASVTDSFAFTGEVVKHPNKAVIEAESRTNFNEKEYTYIEKDFRPVKGDKILFMKDTGTDIEYQGEKMKVVEGSDIIMKLD